jgi:DNA-directed RNA polymerase I, II, and III subunit RPABC2
MSDNEEVSDYESENDENENEDNEPIVNKNIKQVIPISINNIDELNSSDEEDDNDIEDDGEDVEIYGGAKSDEDEEEEEEEEEEEDEEENEASIPKTKKKTKLIIENNVDDEDDNDSDDDDNNDENYLQKFNKDINQSYIEDFHPECKIHNYDEISILTRVVRDNENIIIDPLHKTIPFLTKYEKARIIGQRAKQIESGAMPLVKVSENIIDGHIIAELELQQKRIPFIIKRPIPGGGCEYWNIKDLEQILF